MTTVSWPPIAPRRSGKVHFATAGALGELAQARIRVAMNLALVAMALLACHYQPELSLHTVWYTFLGTVSSALLLLAWAKRVITLPAGHPLRLAQRTTSIVLDNAAISWVLCFGGQTLAGVYVVYLWLTIGYGTRYGPRYLYANLLASVVGFSVVVAVSPFWHTLPTLSVGLMFGLVIIPAYAAYLITLLHQTLQRAEAAVRAKSDFLAKMSHELRTPLHGIIALAELFHGEMSDTQRKEMIRLISSSSNTLLDLINRILDISKYESGSFVLQTEVMDLHATVAETMNILLPQAAARQLDLSVYVDAGVVPAVVGSPRQIQEIMVNLAGNALKFTERGRVTLALFRGAAGPEAGEVRICIRDTGPGMSPEYLLRVFDPFSQADDSITRQHGGTGLGTTIARDLVALMKGRIDIDSTVGVGTSVEVRLPLPLALADERLDMPEQIVLIGFGLDASTIRERLSRLTSCQPEELGVGELYRQLSRLSPRTLVVAEIDSAESVIEMLRSDMAARGHHGRPLVVAYGAPSMQQRAVDVGAISLLTEQSSREDLERILHFAGLLSPRDSVAVVLPLAQSPGLVLIAEDNATNQLIAKLTLERVGYRCHIVGDGERALDELRSGAYDLALLDMHMPAMDGMEVARLYNFAAADDSRRTPIIMVTADNRPDLVADADFAGITRFATKPLKPSVLIQAVQDILAARRAAPVLPRTERSTEAQEILDERMFSELLEFMDLPEARDFFSEFETDARGYIETVRLAANGGVGSEKIRQQMHTLCGAARSVGARELADLARRVEHADVTLGSFKPAALAAQLDATLASAVASINAHLEAAAFARKSPSAGDSTQTLRAVGGGSTDEVAVLSSPSS